MAESRVDLDVIDAIESGSSSIRRRFEIYESDGETLWMDSAETPRMTGGAVTVDYNRDERRSIDVTLDNSDEVLDHNPNGFWYDKILKVYRGVEFRNTKRLPSILVAHNNLAFNGDIVELLRRMGFTDIRDMSEHDNLTIDDFYGYDIILYNAGGFGQAPEPEHRDLIIGAYNAGYNIFTAGTDTTEADLPFATASINKGGSEEWQFAHPPYDTPVARGWTDGSVPETHVGKLITGLDQTATAAAIWTYNSRLTYPAIMAQNPNGARWFHLQVPIADNLNSARQNALIEQSLKWLYGYTEDRFYEFQVGEFCIDSINQDHFPSLIRVTGRDYTKKLLQAKFEQSVTFLAGTSVDQLVGAVAANAGITSTLLDAGGAILGADVSFERSTERWKAIKDVCTAANVEVFFNRQGRLVTRRFLDPTTAPISVVLGADSKTGNLVSYTKKSSDTRVFNVVVVTSENQDDLSGGFLYWARAENTEPSSPTRVSKLGPRHDFIETTLLRSVAECQALADQRLKVSALEEFELSFSSLTYPWLEVGEIARFLDPKPGVDEPDRFLLTSLTIPLSLGPMSGTGKRITIVGGGSVPGELILA